ncbi:hypothetical protein PanWU01x14_039080 [Parasponia andersonii]|uniref:Uncharacterized protein n=1 Tax=Parasponia andersonii TaxID=3476 RepID=A0A2P5DRN3_PARAD|nr:hypothetical protein PanWU01x14_039080 [Parasponia andersonii]
MIDAHVINNDESHHEEPKISGRTLGLFDNENSSEEENQEWIKEEELQNNTCESSAFDIQIIMPLPSIKDHIYDNPI